MSLNGKFLDKDHLQYFWTKIKMKFASAEQGAKADTALQQSDVTSTYSASGTAPVNGIAVNAAIETLDVSSVGGSGKYISEISETDGKISATAETMDTIPTSGSTKAVTSGGVQAPLAEVINSGAKNKLKNTATSTTVGEAVFTVNADGTVTVHTTATTTASRSLQITSSGYVDSTDICTCTPDVEYNINTQFAVGSSGNIKDIPKGEAVSAGVSGNIRYFTIFIRAGVNIPQADAITFRPMICTKAEWNISQDYVPYGMTNADLTKEKVSMVDAYGRGIEIPENADLHTYTTPGVYYSPSSTRSATLTNVPTTGAGFRLVVTELTTKDGTRIRHDAYVVGSNSSTVYSENLGAVTTTFPDGWRPWRTFGPVNSVLSSAGTDFEAPSAKAVYDSQAAQDAEIAWNVNQGVKNLLRFDLESVKSLNGGTWSGNANTINGVTTTVNDTDKTISFVKTASGGDVYFRLTTALQSILSSGSKYILSGATGGSSTTFYLGNSGNWENMNGDTEITYTGSFASIYVCVKSTMPLNTTITIKPMIRPAFIADSTFQSYALPNPTLTPAAIKAVDEGSKNKFQITKSPSNSIVTVNADQTISVVGSTGSSNLSYTLGTFVGEVGVTYHISGCPTGGSSSTWRLVLSGIEYDYGDGFDYVSDGTERDLTIFVKSGQTVNLNFKPMVCTASDWNVSHKYVPYCPSLPDIFKWDEYECLYTSSPSVIAKLNTTTSSVKVRINNALRRVVIIYKLVFIANFATGTDNAFGFGTITPVPNYSSYYPFDTVRCNHISADYTMSITKSNTNALVAIAPISGTITSGTTISGQIEYTY